MELRYSFIVSFVSLRTEFKFQMTFYWFFYWIYFTISVLTCCTCFMSFFMCYFVHQNTKANSSCENKWQKIDWKPEFFQFRHFTVDVALTPVSAGVFRRMWAWSVGPTAACFTMTQHCRLQHRESQTTTYTVHRYEEIWAAMLSKCLDT